MKDITIVVKTIYDFNFLKSKEKEISEEIKSIVGISTVRTAVYQTTLIKKSKKLLVADIKICIGFLNEQEINKNMLDSKISEKLKNILDVSFITIS